MLKFEGLAPLGALTGAASFFLLACGSAHAGVVELVKNGDFTQLSNGVGQLAKPTVAYPNTTVATGWSTGGYNFVETNGTAGAWAADGGLVRLWTKDNIDKNHTNSWDGNAPSGNFLALDGDFLTKAVTQTISDLIVGQSYVLSFNYAFGQQYGFGQTVTEDLTVKLGGFRVTLPGKFSHCGPNGNNCTGGYLNPEHGFSGWETYSTTIVATASKETLSFLADGSKAVPPFSLVSDVSLLGPAAPEPSTWAMMLLGFAGLGYAGLRSARGRTTIA